MALKISHGRWGKTTPKGACCRKAMTPQELWTLLSFPDKVGRHLSNNNPTEHFILSGTSCLLCGVLTPARQCSLSGSHQNGQGQGQDTNESSVSSSQPIMHVPKRTRSVYCRSHRVCCRTQCSETMLETIFCLFPKFS